MKNNLLIKIFIILFLFTQTTYSKDNKYLDKGIKHFNNNNLEKSKIFFERDLVFNPKSEKSYLYLAKIFMEEKNEEEQKINLENVLLLNPKNDEAIYMLTMIMLEQSDYDKAKKLINEFNLVCKSFCSKKEEMESKFNKLSPKNE